jgi:hypothetical protein
MRWLNPRHVFVVTEKMAAWKLLAAKGVLYAANGILNFAFHLVSFSFTLELGIARHFSSDFLDFASNLFGRAFDAVLIHWKSPFAPLWRTTLLREKFRHRAASHRLRSRWRCGNYVPALRVIGISIRTSVLILRDKGGPTGLPLLKKARMSWAIRPQ